MENKRGVLKLASLKAYNLDCEIETSTLTPNTFSSTSGLKAYNLDCEIETLYADAIQCEPGGLKAYNLDCGGQD